MNSAQFHLPQTKKDLEEIHSLIKPYILKTPVLANDVINELCGGEVFFKCENFQKIGAFKARGAVHAIKRLTKEQLKNGVATHSSGNHAQALAYAAQLVNCRAFIVMPENSPKIKLEGVKRLGGEIVLCESTPEAREKKLDEVVAKTNAFFVPPFNHEWVIAGQGTATKELMEDIDGLDCIIAPVGGGGLLSGTAITAGILNSRTKVFGAEPENMNDAQRSFRSGKIEKNEKGKTTIADGLRTTLGEKTLSCIQHHVEDIFSATEVEIIESMKLMWNLLKITAEPSSALPIAVMLKHKELFKGKRTGIIVSGGNVDLSSLPF